MSVFRRHAKVVAVSEDGETMPELSAELTIGSEEASRRRRLLLTDAERSLLITLTVGPLEGRIFGPIATYGLVGGDGESYWITDVGRDALRRGCYEVRENG